MGYQAIEVLDDAYAATRSLLVPVSARRWLVLGVVVAFVGWSSGLVGSINLSPGSLIDLPWGINVGVDLDAPRFPSVSNTLVVLAGLVVALIVGPAVALLSSIFQFVFVRQLTERRIRLRGYVGPSVGPGVRLLVLWVALVLVLAAIAVAFVVLTVLTLGLFALVLVPLIPVFFVAAIGLWVFVRFTIDFVVPMMLVDERGVVDAWGRLYEAIRADTAEFGVYALVRAGLDIAAGVIVGVAGAIVAIALGIPAFILGVLVVGAVGVASPAIAAVLGAALAVVVGFAALVVVVVLVGVPVQTYLRYHALFVLAELEPRYDLLEAVRDATEDEAPAGQ